MEEKTWEEDGELLKECPDGTVIVVAERRDGKWHYSHVECLK